MFKGMGDMFKQASQMKEKMAEMQKNWPRNKSRLLPAAVW